jgi:hypothetical protein
MLRLRLYLVFFVVVVDSCNASHIETTLHFRLG